MSSPLPLGASRLTATGLAVGSTAYMSPEQASSDPRIDHRTDLYSLGMVWYEMLAGAHPFATLSPQQQVAAHFTRTIEPLRTVRPSIPDAVAEMVARCLEKRPADRWQDSGALLRQLDAYLTGDRGTARRGVAAEPTLRSFRLDEELLGTLANGFDPRMSGDAIEYLDNGKLSDTLVCYLTRWSIDAGDAADVLRQTQYRAIAPVLFGFEAGRRYRISLPLDDHLALQGALLSSVARASGATRVILMGFSTGADLVMRLAAAPRAVHAVPIDGVLALGGNLATETAFLSSVLAQMGDAQEDQILPFLRQVTENQSRLQDWLDVNEYLVRLVRRFRTDFGILRDFAQAIASPFDEAPLRPFVSWYRASVAQGTRVRCVFEDNAVYRGNLRQLQPGKGTPLLGDEYQQGSLLIEPGAGHFDLEQTEVVLRYLDAFVAQLRGM